MKALFEKWFNDTKKFTRDLFVTVTQFCVLMILALLVADYASSETIDYSIITSKYDDSFSDHDKLKIYIEVDLVEERLPTKTELESVSKAIKSDPEFKDLAKTANQLYIWFFLPGMKLGSGAFANHHRAPIQEELKITDYTLYNTQYQHFLDAKAKNSEAKEIDWASLIEK